MPKQYLVDLDLNGQKVLELGDPSGGTDAANKQYVDGLLLGTEIGDLAALLATAIAAGDLLTLVDVSDTSMAATGTNKKMTVQEFISGVAGLGLLNYPARGGTDYLGPYWHNVDWGSLGNGRLRFTAFVVPRYLANGIDRINYNVRTAGSSGSIVRVGLYASGSDGAPTGSPLCDSTGSGEATGNIAVTVSTSALHAGLYYLAQVGQGSPSTAPELYRISSTVLGPRQSDPNGFSGTYYQDSVTGALPTVSLSGVNDFGYAMRARVAA